MTDFYQFTEKLQFNLIIKYPAEGHKNSSSLTVPNTGWKIDFVPVNIFRVEPRPGLIISGNQLI